MMLTQIKKVILTLTTLMIAQSSFGEQWLHRCQSAAEATGVTYTMNAPQTQAVRKWMIRCSPRFSFDLTQNDFMYRSDNGTTVKIPLYPLLGKLSMVPDASTDTGLRVEYSNPLNYQIDVAGVTTNPDTFACNIPSDYQIIGYCGAGCFTPDQQLWFPQGDVAIGLAEKIQLNSIISVTSVSTFGDLNYQKSKLTPAMYIQNQKAQKENVLTLMTNEKAITVTPNHPMLMASGAMKQASDVIVGDALVNINGQSEKVLAIEENEFYGKVLNIQTDEKELQSHIVAAQGLLTGDFLIQNINLNNANRFLMRNTLFPVELLKN